MIQPQTYLTIADNTGARKIMCIRILGGNKKYGRIGDVIIGVVKDASPNMPVKRSDIVRAVVVRTKHILYVQQTLLYLQHIFVHTKNVCTRKHNVIRTKNVLRTKVI